jgi:type IV secretion system protein VirD4
MAKVVEGKEEEMSELDFVFEKRKEAAPKALSVQYYDEFKQAAGKTMQSILISTTTKLQHFKLPNLRNLTHKDTIGLETLGDRKTALFIIIPSTDKTYNFLAAMMYMQLFDTLFDRAIQKYGGRLPFHVRFVLDEFANVGKIPDFETVLATMRKFELSATVILQNLAQLKRLYEKSWEEIPGNCDTMLYLGGKDQSTNEYISKDLGKETIDTLALHRTKSRQGSTSYNDGILGRELLTPDELAKMDNSECVVMIRGLPTFNTLKYRLEKHPRYGHLEECDKENNTFRLDSIVTEAESIVIEQTGLEGLVFDFDELIKEQAKIEVIPEGKRRRVVMGKFAGMADEFVKSISGAVWKREVLNGKAA